MTNIVVFGKPRAFESYEYIFEGSLETNPENTHREPAIKPKRNNDHVLHYFVKDDYVGLEYYTRAKGFESDRDGIVFGIALKSDIDFNLIDTKENILIPFWEDFAGALLDNDNRFLQPNIIDSLKNTKWSNEEILSIKSTTINRPVLHPNKETMLLVAPEVTEITKVESQIKEFSDVYITDTAEIFKDPINEVILQVANNKIFTIANGVIEPIVESGRGRKKKATKWGDKKQGGINGSGNHMDNNVVNRSSNSEYGNGIYENWWQRNKSKVVGLVAVLLIGIPVLFFILNSQRKDIVTVETQEAKPSSQTSIVPRQSEDVNSAKYAAENNKTENGDQKGKNNGNKNPTTAKIVTETSNKVEEPKITVNDITILFDNGRTMNSVFFVGDKITVTAKIKGEKAVGGKWSFETGLYANRNINPTVVEIKELNRGQAKLTYTKKGVSKSVNILISR